MGCDECRCTDRVCCRYHRAEADKQAFLMRLGIYGETEPDDAA